MLIRYSLWVQIFFFPKSPEPASTFPCSSRPRHRLLLASLSRVRHHDRRGHEPSRAAPAQTTPCLSYLRANAVAARLRRRTPARHRVLRRPCWPRRSRALGPPALMDVRPPCPRRRALPHLCFMLHCPPPARAPCAILCHGRRREQLTAEPPHPCPHCPNRARHHPPLHLLKLTHPIIATLSCRSAAVAEETRRQPPASVASPPRTNSGPSETTSRCARVPSYSSPTWPSPPVSELAGIRLASAAPPLFFATRNPRQ